MPPPWTLRPAPGAGQCHVCSGCPGQPFGEGCFFGHSLVLSLGGAGVVTWGGAALEVAPRRRAVLVPSGEGGPLLAVQAPFLPLTLRLDHLQQRLELLLGGRAPEPLRFEPQVVLDEGPGADLLRLLDVIVQVFPEDRGALGAPPVLGGLVDALGTALLLCHGHNHTARLSRAGAAAPPREVRLAQAHLDAHFAEPLRMEEVARAAGAPLRTLQDAFRRHEGRSLRAALQDRRLQHARFLLSRSPGASVAQVALDCGLGHLGRFSAAYRQRFGESPTDTLRRARRDLGVKRRGPA